LDGFIYNFSSMILRTSTVVWILPDRCSVEPAARGIGAQRRRYIAFQKIASPSTASWPSRDIPSALSTISDLLLYTFPLSSARMADKPRKLKMAPPESAEKLAKQLAQEQLTANREREFGLAQSLAPFRVGSVPHLNAVPLTRGLEDEIIFAT